MAKFWIPKIAIQTMKKFKTPSFRMKQISRKRWIQLKNIWRLTIGRLRKNRWSKLSQKPIQKINWYTILQKLQVICPFTLTMQRSISRTWETLWEIWHRMVKRWCKKICLESIAKNLKHLKMKVRFRVTKKTRKFQKWQRLTIQREIQGKKSSNERLRSRFQIFTRRKIVRKLGESWMLYQQRSAICRARMK